MQNGPPYAEQSVGPTNELPSTSALPPVSETAAHSLAVDPSAKVTDLICSGLNPSQCAWSKESQKVWPGMQNWLAGLVYGEVCPISQTNEFGVSSTRPQPSALPICCLSNAGSIGPYLLFRVTVPDWPVVTSVTLIFHPGPGAPT